MKETRDKNVAEDENTFSKIELLPADQQRSLEVGEGEESEDAGEQLGGEFVDQWASSKLVHNSRLIFDCQVSPWLKLAAASSLVCCRADSES